MKKIIVSSIFAAAAYTVGAAPLLTIGDQLDLFFKGSVIGKWDSNITYTHNANTKFEDYAAVFRLGAEADYGRNSKFKANIKFDEDITRYADEKAFDSNLSHVKANASYEGANYKVLANFSFDQYNQNTADTVGTETVGKLIRYNYYTAGVRGSYDFSEKLFGELGFKWAKYEYLGEWKEKFSDIDTNSIPVSLFYRVTEKISVGLTYQYRYTEFSGGHPAYLLNLHSWMPDLFPLFNDSRSDHFGGVTVRGELLPKLTSEIYLGVGYRDFTVNGVDGSDTTFAMSGSLAYEVTEKLGVYISGSRDFGSGALRQSTIVSMGEIGVNYDFSQQVSGVASFTYSYTDYTNANRTDDGYIARIGLNYVPNKFITVAANYRYLDNASSYVYTTYMQHLVDISVSLKY